VHGLAVHVLDEAVQHRHGVVDDALVAAVRAVQQPAGQLHLGVQHGSLGDPGVAALAGGGVRGDGGFGGRAAGGEQPVQVQGRVADAQRRPAEYPGDRVVRDQERVGRQRPVDHGRRELPEGVVVRGLLPPAQQRRRKVARVRGTVDHVDRGGAALLRALLGETRGADERGRQGVDRGDRTADRP